VKSTSIQAGNQKENHGLIVYSVRERREQRYTNNSEKRTVNSIKRQARGGVRGGGLYTRGLLYRQPSHGQYINYCSCGEASDGNNIYIAEITFNVLRKASDGIHSRVTLQYSKCRLMMYQTAFNNNNAILV
jgi:hypothetical protein